MTNVHALLFTKQKKRETKSILRLITRMNALCHTVEVFIVWATSSQNLPSNIHKIGRFLLSCHVQSNHPGLCSPFIHSVVSNDSVSGQ